MDNISKQHDMLLSNILEIELFNVWGFDFMGPILRSYNNGYILIIVDYVSKCVETIDSPTTDSAMVRRFFKKTIFQRFWVSCVIISDSDSHFINCQFDNLLKNTG
jgi:hypothetical protein